MPRDVVVLFVHGINTTDRNYHKPLLDRIARRLPTEAQRCLVPRPVFWGDIVRGRTDEYLYDAIKAGNFKPHKIHGLAIGGLGDAAAYTKTEQIHNSAYYKIQAEFRKALGDVAQPPNDERPLVVIAHSLGCHIASTYAWDLHKYKHDAKRLNADPDLELNVDPATRRYIGLLDSKTAIERLDTFAGFVTMGCNMPLFTFTYGQHSVTPITHSHRDDYHPPFPGETLERTVKVEARWRNYYSLNDPLGYPLKPLNDKYGSDFYISDHVVTSEGAWRKALYAGPLRPLAAEAAHANYWFDDTVAAGAADLIQRLMYAPLSDELSLFPGLPSPIAL